MNPDLLTSSLKEEYTSARKISHSESSNTIHLGGLCYSVINLNPKMGERFKNDSNGCWQVYQSQAPKKKRLFKVGNLKENFENRTRFRLP